MRRTYVYLPFDEEGFRKFFAELLQKELSKLQLIKAPEQKEDTWLSVTETANMLGREKSRVYAYTRSSILKGYRIPGLRCGLRYRKSEVEQCLKALDFSHNIKTKQSNF